MIRKTKHPDNRAARRALKFKKEPSFNDTVNAEKIRRSIEARDKDLTDDVGSEVSGSA